MKEYLAMWKHYADFKGRATRKDFWMAYLFNCIAAVIIGIIAGMVTQLAFLSVLYSLAILIPSISIGVRRLHDIGKRGVMLLISLIPLVGAIMLLVYWCKPSFEGANEFGEQFVNA